MKTYNELKLVTTDFFRHGITGWCLEVMFTSVESIMAQDWRLMGKTSLLMFLIYGMGALLEPVEKRIGRWLSVTPGEYLRLSDGMVRHGVLYMVLIFIAEYISGAWLRLRRMYPWDYTGKQTNINGLIRLDFAPLWLVIGLLFKQITRGKDI